MRPRSWQDLGQGVFDHSTPWRLLEAAGYDGYFSIEVIHAPGSDHDAEGVLKQVPRERALQLWVRTDDFLDGRGLSSAVDHCRGR